MNRRLCSEYTWAMRFKTIMVALGHAVRLGTFPTGQSVYYGHLRDSVFGWPLNELLWIFAAVAVCAAISDGIGCRRTLFGVGWFLLTFFPVSNIIPTGVLVAERTLYLPVLGICFLAAVVLDRITLTDSSVRLVARGGLVAIVLLSAARGASGRPLEERRVSLAFDRASPPTVAAGSTSSWASHSSTVAADRPGSPLRRRTCETATAFKTAYELNPGLPQALTGSGIVAMLGGDLRTAEQFLLEAARRLPGDPEVQSALRACRWKRAEAPCP